MCLTVTFEPYVLLKAQVLNRNLNRAPKLFYFSCSRHVSKSANLIGRIVFDAARRTKKTQTRGVLNDAFTRGVFWVGVHTHIGALCLVTRR